ncbi:MAG: hypothetical protein GX081_03595, partial [Firmicutes bacterium]|nr:hypothetical protein [Bacillota bacterium]
MNRRFSYSILVIILVLALLTVLSGCGPKKKVSTLKRIELEPAQITVTAGGTVQFTAKGYDQYGKEMEGLTFRWSVPKEAGEITSDGLFTAGDKEGIYKVVCEANDIKAEIEVRVNKFAGDGYLQSIGEQLVHDSQTAWDNFSVVPRLSSIFNDQLVPGFSLVISVIDTVMSNVPGCYDPLYYYTQEPGTDYVDLNQIYEGEPQDSPQTGSWRYNTWYEVYDEETDEYLLTASIKRELVNDKDQITFSLQITDLSRNKIGTYNGKILYPTANWERWKFEEEIYEPTFPDGTAFPYKKHFDIPPYNDSMEISIAFEHSDGTNGNINLNGFVSESRFIDVEYDCYEYGGDYYVSEDDSYSIIHSFSGDANGSFTIDDQQYSFDGKLCMNFSEESPDYFTGEIKTPEAFIDSNIEISYVKNSKVTEPLFRSISTTLVPNRLSLSGSVQDTVEDLVLEGTFVLELENAANYDFNAPYSEDNLAGIKLNFSGLLGHKNINRMAGTLSFQETDYKEFSIEVGYNLTHDGVNRRIGLNATTVDAEKVAIEITSDWGPATIMMDLTFDPEFLNITESGLKIGKLKNVSGKVLVQGLEVGTVEKSDLGFVLIKYI